ELTQAEAELEAAAQRVPALELAIRRQENALRVLTGEVPGPIERGSALDALSLPTVPAGLPSELLRRRPDIAQAEAQLAASDANLAAARAQFLPQVRLGASLSALVSSALRYDPITLWNLGGSILAPIFNGGRLQAQADAAAARRDQAAWAYRGVTLTAFAEVESGLEAVQRLEQQGEHARAQRDVLARSLRLAHNRYTAGYASYLEELDAQRGLLSAQLAVIQIAESQLSATVSLYQALGGGWSSPQ
ncbi:MAG: TolC family protein, partial [Myxococcaceae bacterium]|nr:TolC family protein [Myxococcaceae bacterium]